MTAKEAFEKWADKREKDTTYRRDRDGRDEWFFSCGFNAAQDIVLQSLIAQAVKDVQPIVERERAGEHIGQGLMEFQLKG